MEGFTLRSLNFVSSPLSLTAGVRDVSILVAVTMARHSGKLVLRYEILILTTWKLTYSFQIVVSFKTSSCDDTSPCWSLLILSPSGFYKPQPGFDINGERAESPRVEYQPNQRLWEESEETPLDRGHPEDAVLQVLIQSIKLIVTRWQNLYEVVRKECDGETVNFMDGEKYGDLLYDDGSFRRSRFYFWAIGCLNSFEQSIADTLSELALFRAAITHYHPWRFMAQECGFKEFDVSDSLNEEEIGELDRVYKRLEKIRLQLEKKCNEMKALRDGVRPENILAFPCRSPR